MRSDRINVCNLIPFFLSLIPFFFFYAHQRFQEFLHFVRWRWLGRRAILSFLQSIRAE